MPDGESMAAGIARATHHDGHDCDAADGRLETHRRQDEWLRAHSDLGARAAGAG